MDWAAVHASFEHSSSSALLLATPSRGSETLLTQVSLIILRVGVQNDSCGQLIQILAMTSLTSLQPGEGAKAGWKTVQKGRCKDQYIKV